MKAKQLATSLSGITGLVLLLAVLIAANVVAGALRVRKDLTQEKLYTLSDGTRSLLHNLQRDVTLKFYFSRSSEAVPIPMKEYAERITDLLREYEAESGGRLVLETYDPKPDSDEEEWAQRYGVARQPLSLGGGAGDLYMGLVAVSGSREAVIPFLAPSAEPRLEYLVTRLVHEVTQTHRPVVGVMSSLPVMGQPAMPFGPRRGPQPWVFVNELKKQYDVRSVDTDVESIPAEIDTLVLVHPKDLPDRTLYALDQFVLRGGHLLAFMDPLCMAEQESSPAPSPQGMMGASSDLNRLTRAWGLTFDKAQVVADPEAASNVSFGQQGGARTPTWLSIRDDLINRDEVATGSLDFLMMPFAGAFTGEPAEGLTRTVLVHDSEKAGLVNAFEAMSQDAALSRSFREKGNLALALRLQGTFKTAFPEGPPKSEAAAKGAEKEAPPLPPGPHLTQSSEPGVVVLVGDVDLLMDRVATRSMNFFGQNIIEPLNDNLNFTLNMVEQLSGSRALIGLRSRGTFRRPFDRVQALEERAQERWRAEELKLQENLRQAQARLRELQGAKHESQKYILSPEQKAEIKKFRRQEFETKRQLKEVRKNLRHDIETLGLRLKIANMALVPLLVVLFGIYRGVSRRRAAAG